MPFLTTTDIQNILGAQAAHFAGMQSMTQSVSSVYGQTPVPSAGVSGGGGGADPRFSTAQGFGAWAVGAGGGAAATAGAGMAWWGALGGPKGLQYADPFMGTARAAGAGVRSAMPMQYAKQGAFRGLLGMHQAGAPGIGSALTRGLGAGAAAMGGYMLAGAVGNWALDQMHAGAQQNFMMSTVLSTANRGNMPQMFGGSPLTSSQNVGQISGMVREMSSASRDFSQLAGIMGQGIQGGFFATTRNVQEFKSRFRELLDTTKTLATAMQTSQQEAMSFMGQQRGMGFTGFQQAAGGAAFTTQMAAGAGVSPVQMAGIGMQGAQIARRYGGRGATGALAAQQTAATLGAARMQGTLSEADIMDMTGGQGGAAGLGSLAGQWQAQALGAMRGRYGRRLLTALMDPQTGQIDPGRTQQFAGGGMSREDLSQAYRQNVRSRDVRYALRARGRGLAAEAVNQIGPMGVLSGVAEMEYEKHPRGHMPDVQRIILQRITGMGEQQSDALRQVISRLPSLKGDIQARWSKALDEGIQAQYRGQGLWERVKNEIYDKSVGKVEKWLKQLGGEMQTSISGWLESTVQGWMGVGPTNVGPQHRAAAQRAYYGDTAGAQQLLGGVMPGGGGGGGGINPYAQLQWPGGAGPGAATAPTLQGTPMPGGGIAMPPGAGIPTRSQAVGGIGGGFAQVGAGIAAGAGFGGGLLGAGIAAGIGGRGIQAAARPVTSLSDFVASQTTYGHGGLSTGQADVMSAFREAGAIAPGALQSGIQGRIMTGVNVGEPQNFEQAARAAGDVFRALEYGGANISAPIFQEQATGEWVAAPMRGEGGRRTALGSRGVTHMRTRDLNRLTELAATSALAPTEIGKQYYNLGTADESALKRVGNEHAADIDRIVQGTMGDVDPNDDPEEYARRQIKASAAVGRALVGWAKESGYGDLAKRIENKSTAEDEPTGYLGLMALATGGKYRMDTKTLRQVNAGRLPPKKMTKGEMRGALMGSVRAGMGYESLAPGIPGIALNRNARTTGAGRQLLAERQALNVEKGAGDMATVEGVATQLSDVLMGAQGSGYGETRQVLYDINRTIAGGGQVTNEQRESLRKAAGLLGKPDSQEARRLAGWTSGVAEMGDEELRGLFAGPGQLGKVINEGLMQQGEAARERYGGLAAQMRMWTAEHRSGRRFKPMLTSLGGYRATEAYDKYVSSLGRGDITGMGKAVEQFSDVMADRIKSPEDAARFAQMFSGIPAGGELASVTVRRAQIEQTLRDPKLKKDPRKILGLLSGTWAGDDLLRQYGQGRGPIPDEGILQSKIEAALREGEPIEGGAGDEQITGISRLIRKGVQTGKLSEDEIERIAAFRSKQGAAPDITGQRMTGMEPLNDFVEKISKLNSALQATADKLSKVAGSPEGG